ncbi:hypothetical protein GCM10008164_48390 [Achromobacter xylosoxidans]|nr:hypothetical protein GCM10008164_48390 [Achromobacter xylosoxidans]
MAGFHGAEFALAQGGKALGESFIAGQREDKSLHVCRVRLIEVRETEEAGKPRAALRGCCILIMAQGRRPAVALAGQTLM